MRVIILVLCNTLSCLANGSIAVGGKCANNPASVSPATGVSVSYTATTGNFLSVSVFSYGTITSHTVTDGTNSYTPDIFQSTSSGAEHVSIAHASSITGGALTITAKANATAPSGMTVCVSEYPSGVTGTVDGTPSGALGISLLAISSGTVTASHANDLLIGAVVSSNSAFPVVANPSSAWTVTQTVVTGTPGTGAMMEGVSTATGNYAAMATMSGSSRLAAVLVAFQCSCGPQPNVAEPSASGIVSASNALWSSSLNTLSVAKNNIATYSGNQYMAWYDTSLVIHITARPLSGGGSTDYNTGFSISTDDEHEVIAIAFDQNGYIHMCYGAHISALNYRRTINIADPSSFGSIITPLVNATDESQTTYPMFTNDPATGQLYLTFQSEIPVVNSQYLYHYVAGTTSWEKATGTDSTNPGAVFEGGGADSVTFYLNGIPKWDSTTGYLWFQGEFRTNSCTGINQYLIGWNKASFIKFGGSTQTIPATEANMTAIVTTNCPTQIQNDFTINSSGVFFIPYSMPDGSSNLQMYVLESHSGSWTQHQLTSNPSGVTVTNTVPPPYSTALSVAGCVWVVYPDAFDVYVGLVSWRSCDDFATSAQQYIVNNYNPNMTLNYDPAGIAAGRVSFLAQDTNDVLYGAIYVTTATPRLGQLLVIDWYPYRSATGRMTTLRGGATLR